MREKSKYKVGQVVSLAGLEFYQNKRKGEQFQKIMQVYPWTCDGQTKFLGFGLRLKNGDQCHEKWVKPLTEKEKGK